MSNKISMEIMPIDAAKETRKRHCNSAAPSANLSANLNLPTHRKKRTRAHQTGRFIAGKQRSRSETETTNNIRGICPSWWNSSSTGRRTLRRVTREVEGKREDDRAEVARETGNHDGTLAALSQKVDNDIRGQVRAKRGGP
uniref:uncharacterized protein LOC117601537 n=1 Tax=Osmia lignaria TaxID=473952 RepID=UPI00147862BD|nr:uncharacterized protein LOC117601537 [Osmia lignaria]